MASSKGYLDFVLEQLSELEEITISDKTCQSGSCANVGCGL